MRQAAFVAILALLAFPAFPAFGADPVDSVGAAANHLGGQAGAFGMLLSGFAYLAGAFFGVRGAVQLRDHSEHPGQTRLSKPLFSVGASTSLLALPGVFGMLSESVFGAGGAGEMLAFAAEKPEGVGFEALSASIPALMSLVHVGAVSIGGFLLLKAIFDLPHLETGRTSASSVGWTMASGIGLWSLLPMIQMSGGSLGMGEIEASNILTAHLHQGSDDFGKMIHSVLLFVSFIGLVAFARGTLLLKSIGENRGGAIGRAMTHILAGAAAMNISWTISILAKSIGFAEPICGLAAGLCG